jgi:hypothetical protein
MSSSGDPNRETRERIGLAAELDSQDPADIIVLCGWAYRPDSDLPIAVAMKRYISHEYPLLAKKSVCQNLSRDTVGDAFFTALLLEQVYRGSPLDIKITTSRYHAERSRLIFEFVFHGRATISVCSPDTSASHEARGESEARSMAAFLQTFRGINPGEMSAIENVLRTRHPFYNGDIHPVMPSLRTVLSLLEADGQRT